MGLADSHHPGDHLDGNRRGKVASSRTRRLEPGVYFQKYVDSNPDLAHAMRNAKRVNDFKLEGDYSYKMDTFAGNGFVLIGDAARFVDPIFSSGVSVALLQREVFSGANQATPSKQNDFSEAALKPYEKKLRSGTISGMSSSGSTTSCFRPSLILSNRRSIALKCYAFSRGRFLIVGKSRFWTRCGSLSTPSRRPPVTFSRVRFPTFRLIRSRLAARFRALCLEREGRSWSGCSAALGSMEQPMTRPFSRQRRYSIGRFCRATARRAPGVASSKAGMDRRQSK